MADFTFATGDALTRKAWAKKWFVESQDESYFYGHGFVGSPESSIIGELSELQKEQGDQVTIGILMKLSGAGVAHDNAMETAEEAPSVYDDAVTISQIRNAVRMSGRESEQMPADRSLRSKVKTLLTEWQAAQIDQRIFTELTTSCTKYIYGGDATGTADIAAGDYMTLALGGKCKTYAQKATPRIKGPTVKGKRYAGVMIMCPDQENDLTTLDGSWSQGAREALPAGLDNPIFTDVIGVRRNVIYHSHPRISLATTWGAGAVNGATALFLGIGAGTIAYAKKKIWEEKTFDYNNKVGFCVGSLYGFTKNVFNAADYAVVGVRTYRSSN